MVVFTCTHCGESCQKPKVEKHYFTVCRKARKSLTCVDCLKDFLDEEYVAHTKCVTEEERYAAKGSFAKAVVKKGELKQESWTEVIQSVIENTTHAKPGQQQILTLLSSSPNVPRKKNKFTNFIKSALARKASDRDIEEVWNMIEKYKGQQSAAPPSENESKPETVNENLKAENGNEENAATNESSKKKKKSKNLKTTETAEEINEINKKAKTFEDENNVTSEGIKDELNVEVGTNGTVIEGLKKKKKSKVILESNGVVEDNNGNADDTSIVENPKKKKRKSKNLNVAESVDSTTNIDTEMKKENKKKKTENGAAVEDQISLENDKHPTVSGVIDDNNRQADDSPTVENLKKKKRKSKNLNENGDVENVSSSTNVDTEMKKKTTENQISLQTTLENDEPTIANGVIENNNGNAEDLSKLENHKKKKRKSKNLNVVESVDSTTNVETEKKTKNDTADEDQISPPTGLENDEQPSVNGSAEKKKAKKRKLENSGTDDVEEAKEKKTKNKTANDDEAVSKEADVQQQNSDSFDYKEKILEILKIKNSISPKKLQKKVLDAYQKVTGKEPSKNVLKKFSKHLKKVGGIEISETNVRLIDS